MSGMEEGYEEELDDYTLDKYSKTEIFVASHPQTQEGVRPAIASTLNE